MDFEKFAVRFRQFGGVRLLWEYAKIGSLWTGVNEFIVCLIKGLSFKAIYPEILKKVKIVLRERYYPMVLERKEYYQMRNLEQKRNIVIWFCWLQGMGNAPELVRVCYESLKRHLPERRIEVIDGNNWNKFVELPEYVVQKWETGRIPAALFCDLLRLELLIKYGGTWIDSTVLCTGFDTQMTQEARRYLDADLFLFQYISMGTTAAGISISNWFITACTNNPVLMILRDILHAYWRDYDCTLNYYIFHQFFGLIAKEYPESIAVMPSASSQRSIVLMHHCGDQFSQNNWDKLVSKVAFHKLSYRVDDRIKNDKENYYNYIINNCG